MEFLFVLAIFLLTGLGLGAGLILTGRPLKGSCGGIACVGGASCDGCPRRKSETEDASDG